MGRPQRITKQHIGRPLDFLGFDGKTYNGRIVEIRRRNWLVFVYYVFGIGEVRGVWDLRVNRDRILEIY